MAIFAAAFLFACASSIVFAGGIVGAVVGVFAGTFVVVVAVAGSFGFLVVGGALAATVARDYWLDTSDMRMTLSALTDLEHSNSPDECIEFVKWCDRDETIRAYQHRLAAMHRPPIRAEYEATKEWVATTASRRSEVKKVALAKQACQRMVGPV